MAAYESPTIVLIADGWTRHVFLDLLDRGMLPDIDKGLIGEGGLIEDVVSNLPSVSIASHASILTGSHQDEHLIPGHRWRESATGEITSYLGLMGRAAVNRDLCADVKTIFEHSERSYSVQGIVRRGATRHVTMPTLSSERILDRTADLAIQDPRATIVSWLPRGDALGHSFGPDSEAVRKEMVKSSAAIGRLLIRLDGQKSTREARLLMVPDHGHRRVNLATDLSKVLAATDLGKLRVNPRAAGKLESIALTSGDASAYLYLPSHSESERIRIARQLVTHESVELVCTTDQSRRGTFISARGISFGKLRQDGHAEYVVSLGQDPLGLVPDQRPYELDLRVPNVGQGFYPDVLHQFLRSHVPGRSGEMLLLAGPETHFSRGPRLGWRFGYHRGSHGGPFDEEVVVAGAFRGAPGRISAGAAVRSADLLARLGYLETGTLVQSST